MYLSRFHKIVKKLWSTLDLPISYYTNNKYRENVQNAINAYNVLVHNKYKLDVDYVYHGLDGVNQLSLINIDHIMEQNIKKIDFSFNVHDLKGYDKKKIHLKQQINEENVQNNININDNSERGQVQLRTLQDILNERDQKKLSNKKLNYHIESKKFNDLFAETDVNGKATLNSLRSDKTMAFTNNYIGIDYKEEVKLNDQE